MTQAHERRVFGLDFYRACAIACVVLSHGGLVFALTGVLNRVPFLVPLTPWLNIIQHGGVVGVELFFVLSGFLIGRILLRAAGEARGLHGLFRFYTRRWFRTLPLFWLFVVFNLLLELGLNHRKIGLEEVLAHAFFLRNFAHLRLSFFGESWSLAVEEWFYLLFAAAVWLAALLPGRFDRKFLALAAGFFVLSLAERCRGALQPGAVWTDAPRCVVLYRFDSLMSGVIAAWISVRHPEGWRRGAAAGAWLGAVVFLAAYGGIWTYYRWGVGLAPDTFFAKTFRFSLFSLSFALFLPAASRWAPAREGWGHAGMRRIALWSYAMYLANWPIFQLMAASRISRWRASWNGYAAYFLLEMAAVTAVSALLYHFYEAPCTRLRERLR